MIKLIEFIMFYYVSLVGLIIYLYSDMFCLIIMYNNKIPYNKMYNKILLERQHSAQSIRNKDNIDRK